MIGLRSQWIQRSFTAHAVGQTSGGLDKAGLATIIIVSVVIIIALVWIFRETGRRE